MGAKSRNKGKRGELEAAAALREHLGIEARRGRQYQGSDESPDVKHSLHGVHVEVKRTEFLNLYKAIDQASDECADGDVPIILHKRNARNQHDNKPWLVIVRLKDLSELAELVSRRHAAQPELEE